jgi:hypothetical protein
MRTAVVGSVCGVGVAVAIMVVLVLRHGGLSQSSCEIVARRLEGCIPPRGGLVAPLAGPGPSACEQPIPGDDTPSREVGCTEEPSCEAFLRCFEAVH